ncbi:hypothetical protein DVH24_041609 [Malus domestica]|uniref:Uncharacterized protein n=1 Tax=Malus domestica TaxID=3750 RepID=A0A498ITT4_MALDO|nr:hypothetical protein DVH24_041609 [Malus domestica]
MSVASPMASPTRRLNLDDQPFLNSRISVGERDALITDRVKEASLHSPSMTKHGTSSVKFFGVELCPDNVVVAMVFCSRCPRPCKACCQGLTFHLKDNLHLDLAKVRPLAAAISEAQVLGGVVHSQGPLLGGVQRNMKSSSVLVIGGLFDTLWIQPISQFLSSDEVLDLLKIQLHKYLLEETRKSGSTYHRQRHDRSLL